MFRLSIFITAFLISPLVVIADDSSFHAGPLISKYGRMTTIESDMPIAEGVVMKVSFDVADQAEEGAVNRSFDSLARFLNMHVEAGVKPEHLQLALVVHGSASNDVMSNADYKARYGKQNANVPLLQELMKHNVEVIICGQSATYYGIAKSDLEPRVKMALSAMTAHALLQQDGYTLNPF